MRDFSFKKLFSLKVVWAALLFFGVNVAGHAKDGPAFASKNNTLSDSWQLTVSGTVRDQDGAPIPGASVVVKGTSIGTATDFDGRYTIDAPSDAILQFSYLGFSPTEVPVNGNTTVDAVLQEDISKLDEVVVVGYGTQSKKEVTGAVSQIDSEDLTQTSAPSVTSGLTGRLPGVFVQQRGGAPGADNIVVRVRGIGTTGSNSALIVIDGVPSRDGLGRLDPSDIESVTVLKDASAAIYGARAANGVVLITTKRGREQPADFSYSFDYGVHTPSETLVPASAAEYAHFVNSINERDGVPLTYTTEQINAFRDGSTPSYNWVDASLGNADQSRHNLSVRGGSERIKYFVSVGYLDQGSVYTDDETTGNEQTNVRSNLDIQVNDRLKLGFDLAARVQNRARIPNDFDPILDASITPPDVQIFINDDSRYPTSGRSLAHPIGKARESGYDRTRRSLINATFRFQYDVPKVDGLAFKGWLAYDLFNRFDKTFVRPWSYYELGDNGEINQISNPDIGTSLQEIHLRNRRITQNYGLSYIRSFGDHNLDVFAAFEKSEFKQDFFGGQNDQFISTAIDEFVAGSASRDASRVFGSAEQSARINYLGRVNYNFKEKYLAQFIFRYDGSERFAEGKRFGFFPGVSLGWLVSEETFLQNSDLVSSLKLRASWGELGNDRIDAFQYLQRFVFGNNRVVNQQDQPGIVVAGEPNPNITWETTETMNLGVDLSLYDYKLNLVLDVFQNNTKDILAPPNASIPSFTGLSLPDQNIAEVRNRGVDVGLNYYGKISNDLTFEVGGTFTYAKNKVVFIDEPEQPEEYQAQTGRIWAGDTDGDGASNGFPLMYRSLGIYRSQAEIDASVHREGTRVGDLILADLNNDGVIDGNDRYRIDRTTDPRLQYGANFGLKYKGLDFSMLWQGAAQSKRWYTFNRGVGNNSASWYARNVYSSQNVNSSLPIHESEWNSDFWLLDTGYLRLKNAELGYTMPKDIIGKIGLDQLRVYVRGFNLLTFSPWVDKGLGDVEQLQDNIYPQTRIISTGLNLTF